MKITKIPGLGRFGVFVDDLDFNNISNEEWLEIGKLHLEKLVTIIRNTNIKLTDYETRISQFGYPNVLHNYRLANKYKLKNLSELRQLLVYNSANGIPLEEEDRKWVMELGRIVAFDISPDTKVLRVSGMKDKHGNPLGMFKEGELLWHSNESGNLGFTPGVSLLGHTGMVGSCTGFLTTPDWYEEQSESFRSELDEMIIEHRFSPGRINPGLNADQDDLMYKNMCPEPAEIPLVIQSPGGIKGLHYSVNTINGIKGMTDKESRAIFDYIDKTLFVDKFIYDHWYQQDNDLCLFDNSITLHRRLGSTDNRLCYRIQHTYTNLVGNVNPYFQEPFKTTYDLLVEDHDRLRN